SAPAPGAPAAPASLPAARYAPRTDLLAVTSPVGSPPRWPSAGFPPPRSARLFPDTPDRDIATELRKQFGKNILDPLNTEVLSPAQADRVARLVVAHFGSPLAPAVRLPDWDTVVASATVRVDPEKPTLGATLKAAKQKLGSFKYALWQTDWEAARAAREELKLDDAALARGSGLYRRWCMQCHGPTGAGDPAQAVEGGPAPRDYRQGVFKYVTAFVPPKLPKKGLGATNRARRADLVRTVRAGIEGTIMPAFPTLTDQDVDDVVSYVIHLSVRGETEFATLATVADVAKYSDDTPDYNGGELDWLFVQHEIWVLLNWGLAAKHPIPVPPEPFAGGDERLKSAVRGFKLYNSSEFACGAACHASYGRGLQLKWDAWGTVAQPRNLTLGVFRGGRGGPDLYARLYGGIGASGMTAFHDKVTGATPGTPDKLWDLVHFLQALPDPADRKRMQALDPDVKFDP
ncbi:MAG: cytochrome c, partial [Planctomycetes bacterium]|nr:cytochrome c [Planctomycetota bacterium]